MVLSGGGALGIAHLGVLHDLEQQQLIASELIGTSMGGIIAACIAIGMNESEIHQKIKAFAGLSSWLKFSFSGNAIVSQDKLISIFEQIFADRKMSDTHQPLKLITTDLRSGYKRVFTSDDQVLIRDAVLGSVNTNFDGVD